MIKDAPYWISFAHLPKWRTSRINELIIKFHHENKLPLEDFFKLSESEWRNLYGLNDKEVSDLNNSKSEIPNNSFLAENLFNEGYELIPITSEDYPKTLKQNLKVSYSPALIYIKGDKQIFREKSVAIVGSRNASDISLEFTDNIAKLASKEFKVVVSGFAKGVDKQALDSAIKYIGRSIIVLPQGILTFSSGFRQYYTQIINGDVLVLSIFHPKAPWKVELAMARNPVIYGLAQEIYVAESDEKGGTWSGVQDGLRKGRKIYVRMPNADEKNANNKLIEIGAVPVDMKGKESYHATGISGPGINSIKNNDIVFQTVREGKSPEDDIIRILQNTSLTATEIISKLNLDWSPKKLNTYIKKLGSIEIVKIRNKNYYRIKNCNNNYQHKLFQSNEK
ncbi:MAG: DNA-processing protein DprA [Ignavibacteria bacterium]|nr:DNA-processing protein DprA [Ignavibacteria bacterium]